MPSNAAGMCCGSTGWGLPEFILDELIYKESLVAVIREHEVTLPLDGIVVTSLCLHADVQSSSTTKAPFLTDI